MSFAVLAWEKSSDLGVLTKPRPPTGVAITGFEAHDGPENSLMSDMTTIGLLYVVGVSQTALNQADIGLTG